MSLFRCLVRSSALPVVAGLTLGFTPPASAQSPLPRTLPAPGAAPIALHCPRLFDSLSGKMLSETTVMIEGDRVKSVEAGFTNPAGARIIELPGHSCIPGLIDSHTHLTFDMSTIYQSQTSFEQADSALRATLYAKRTLMAGFTTVRDLADDQYASVSLRNHINGGWVVGPRIYTAGPPIGTTGGHADFTDGLKRALQTNQSPQEGIINSPSDAWQAVRQHYKQHVDLIKIIPSGGVADLSSSVDNPQMTLEEIQAVVGAAKDYGFPVAAHAHGAEAVRRAVVAGVDSIEHAVFMDEADMKLMKAHGTFYVPTVYVVLRLAEMARAGKLPPPVIPKALKAGPQVLRTVASAYKAGVKFAYGTDTSAIPHGENWRDFKYLVEAGLPPAYTLQMATINAAQLLRHADELGSVTPGKLADIVAVPGDPITDIDQMSKVDFVMRAGVVYKQGGVETADALPQ